MSSTLDLTHRLPVTVQNGAISLYGLYLQQRRYGGASGRLFRELVEHESWSADRIGALTLELLRRRALVALERVPAYESLRPHLETVRRAATCEQIQSVFPVLTKEDVRLAPESFVPEGLLARTHRASTSGTTGTPLTIFRTVAGLRRCFAFFRRVRRWRGLSHWSRAVTLMGRQVVPVEQARPPFWRHAWFTRNLLLSSYHMTPQTLPLYSRRVARFNPEQIVCYPSSGVLLARALLDSGERLADVRAVFTTAESVSQEQRELMEEAFGAPVADQYGSGEWTVWISQCEEGTYHLHPDFGYLEVLDEQGKPVRSGRGIATGFVNDAMVLMRYDTGDVVALGDGGCGCGRSFPTVASVEGRRDDFIETPDGRLVGRLDHVFKELEGVVECQLVQQELDLLEARVVAGGGWGEDARRRLTDELNARLGSGMRIQVSIVPTIERTENGKFRAVIGLERRQGSTTGAEVT